MRAVDQIAAEEVTRNVEQALETSGYLDAATALVALKVVLRKAVAVGASHVDIRQAVEETLP
jgi:hypothetical protein